MTNNKLRTVVFALIFGLVATLMAAVYIGSVKANVEEQAEKTPVLMAIGPIPAGTAGAALIEQSLVEKREVPKRYQARDALSGIDSVKNKVLVTSLSAGEQVTSGKFRSGDNADVSLRLVAGNVAVTLPVDEGVGIAGQVRPGDRVTVYGTFKPGPGGTDRTQQLLSGIEVLAVGVKAKDGGSVPGANKPTITVSVNPVQAEKLVFTQEKGHIWFGVLPVTGDVPGATPGQTVESVFD